MFSMNFFFIICISYSSHFFLSSFILERTDPSLLIFFLMESFGVLKITFLSFSFSFFPNFNFLLHIIALFQDKNC